MKINDREMDMMWVLCMMGAYLIVIGITGPDKGKGTAGMNDMIEMHRGDPS